VPLPPFTRECRGPLSPDASRSASLALPAPAPPLANGAIRSTEEKLTFGLATSAAKLSVPIPTTAARRGFGPTLTLSYDSAAGNEVFGLSWRLSVPSITRKTLTGWQQYRDAADSDVFVLNNAEVLVPWRDAPTRDSSGRHLVRRPRVEDAFARIEWWQETATGDIHWPTISRDNVTPLFGSTASSRIYDPANPSHAFGRLLSFSYRNERINSRYAICRARLVSPQLQIGCPSTRWSVRP